MRKNHFLCSHLTPSKNYLKIYRRGQTLFQSSIFNPITLSPKADSLNFDFPETPSFLNDFDFPLHNEILTKPTEINAVPPNLEQHPPFNNSAGSEEILEATNSSAQKRKRGRKPKIMTVEDKMMGTQRRLERNRVFARENRKRKKEYIASLEAEVYSLLFLD